MLKKLFPYTKGVRLTAVLTSIFVACETILEVYIPFLMAEMVDVGIANTDLSFIISHGLKMVGVAAAALFFGVMSGRFAAVAATGFAQKLRGGLFHAIQDFSFANIDRFSTASLITRLTVDINNTQMAFMMTTRLLVRAPVMLIAATIMAFRINAELSSIFFMIIPALAVVLAIIIRTAYPRFGKMLEKYDLMNAAIQEKLTGIRLIKAFVREDHETERFRNAAEELRQYQIRAEKIVIINMPVMMCAIYGCTIAVLWLGGQQIIAGTMEAGMMLSFLTYISQIMMSLMMIAMAFVGIVLSVASMRRICECLNEKLDISDANLTDEQRALTLEDGSIRFRDVNFSYSKNEERLNLRHINLEIASGMTVGIVGGTGSAKTTLVQLIPRLYDVTGGELIVGGHDVRDYTLEHLRSEVAMVLQNNLLFSGTIADNLRWGHPDATDEELEQACRAAQAHDFITSFPEGYQTMLGQAGVNVSGGQKQRLTIARALIKQPKIIILDDSTSAVDTATDAALREAFTRELSHVTTIIIAQRISSIMDSDLIVVLDEGQIIATGVHDELMQSCDVYREVYESQHQEVA